MPSVAYRLDNLPPYVFAVIGDRIAQMQAENIDVIRFDIGNPDMPPPDDVIAVLDQSARRPDKHGYSGYRGIPAFRKAIAQHYQNRFDVSLEHNRQVLPLIGSKEGIVNLCLAYLDRGDLALVPDVGYPAYSMGAQLAGAEIHWLPMNDDYLVDFSQIPADVAAKAKLMWLNYPNNPTGRAAPLEFYEEAIDFCREHDILLASDNPYVDVMFAGKQAHSLLEAAGNDLTNVVEFFSFSKSYNMAGWRLGAMVGDREAISNLLLVKSNVDSGHFKPVYDAGIAALQTPQSWLDERNAIYQQRRDRILDALPEIGLSAEPSDGSLYVWANVRDLSVDDYVEQALVRAHVSIAPGLAYGPGGEGFVRISIATPDDVITQALANLKAWYASL